MRRIRLLSRSLPLAATALLLPATPAFAGGVVGIADGQLVYAGDDHEPLNVTVSRAGALLRLDELGTRIALGDGAEGCVLSEDRYRVECPAAEIERVVVRAGSIGSDVRIRAALAAEIHGGDGDDLLIGGPREDVIDGGGGKDVVGGGGGADELRGGPDEDLVTYLDRIARDGSLRARTGGIVARFDGRPSGAPGEGDALAGDLEQVEGGAGADRFELSDGRTQSVTCGAGRDVAILDVRDEEAIDCERGEVDGTDRSGRPTLAFPFPAREDRGTSVVQVRGRVPLHGRSILVRIACQRPIGLLAADGPGCSGTARMSRAGVVMAERRIALGRGHATTWRVPLTTSLPLARRAGGLPVTVTALPTRGAGVRRDIRFTVFG